MEVTEELKGTISNAYMVSALAICSFYCASMCSGSSFGIQHWFLSRAFLCQDNWLEKVWVSFFGINWPIAVDVLSSGQMWSSSSLEEYRHVESKVPRVRIHVCQVFSPKTWLSQTMFTSHICTGEVVLTADEVLNEDGSPGVVIRLQRTLLKHPWKSIWSGPTWTFSLGWTVSTRRGVSSKS